MDKDEFAGRIEHIQPRLFRTAMLYLGGEAMARDAVSEAVYRGFLSLKKLREPEYLETWITRILINECRKELRRSKRVQPLDVIPETAEERYDSLPLKEAISRLPAELADVIILRYFSDLTLAETARALNIPQGTVVTRQRRALKILRMEFMENEEEVRKNGSQERILRFNCGA